MDNLFLVHFVSELNGKEWENYHHLPNTTTPIRLSIVRSVMSLVLNHRLEVLRPATSSYDAVGGSSGQGNTNQRL